mgnify:FL=1
MRVDTRPRHRNSGRPAHKSARGYLAWLRGRNCCIGGTCAGRIEAAHVDYAGDKGMGTKASDCYAVPMCSAHHAEQHMAGVKTFEARHSINLLSVANSYWRAWPGRAKWEAENARSND